MPTPIFRSRSYIFTIGVPEEVITRLSVFGERFGFRVTNFESLDEVKTAMVRTDHIHGIIAGQPIEAGNILHPTCGEVALYTLGQDLVIDQNLETQLLGALNRGVSEQYQNMVELAVDTGFNSLNKMDDVKFYRDNQVLMEPDIIVYCDAIENDLYFRVQISLSFTDELRAFSQQFQTEAKFRDFFEEACNQIMGVISFNMRRMGISCRVGLPIFADLRTFETPKFFNFMHGCQLSANAIPGVSIYLGYMNTMNNPVPDFEKLASVDSPSDEVDFL